MLSDRLWLCCGIKRIRSYCHHKMNCTAYSIHLQQHFCQVALLSLWLSSAADKATGLSIN